MPPSARPVPPRSDPAARRHRYAFTNCTHCGPRLTIVAGIPYDRARTTMARLPAVRGLPRRICATRPTALPCRADRLSRLRPAVALVRLDGAPRDPGRRRCGRGGGPARSAKVEIVAIKGLGGYQLACDATDDAAVARLRQAKRRDGQAVRADGARPAPSSRATAPCGAEEAARARKPARADRAADAPRAGAAAGGDRARAGDARLHAADARRCTCCCSSDFDRPLVMTSGNLSGEPQVHRRCRGARRARRHRRRTS